MSLFLPSCILLTGLTLVSACRSPLIWALRVHSADWQHQGRDTGGIVRTLEGTARYAGQLLALAEGICLQARAFFSSPGQKKTFLYILLKELFVFISNHNTKKITNKLIIHFSFLLFIKRRRSKFDLYMRYLRS